MTNIARSLSEMNNFNNPSPCVFVGALDWGLGHASRCIPLIRCFEHHGCKIIIGATGEIGTLLKAEFPHATFVKLPAYRIRYSRKKRGFLFKLMLQVPHILRSVFWEHRLLKRYISEYGIDVVISDNRFGLYARHIQSVYISHQLNILGPSGKKNWFATRVHRAIMKRFAVLWVPDAGSRQVAGKLSDPDNLAMPVQYLGIISRFNYLQREQKFDLCICLSGPEPQRTLLEELLIKQIDLCDQKIVFIRGLPASNSLPDWFPAHVTVYNHLPAARLNQIFCECGWIIARSGYTTIMDLIATGKRAVLIPTPGQYEQEYLAKHLEEKGYFLSRAQENFSLREAIVAYAKFDFSPLPPVSTAYETVIEDLLHSLQPSIIETGDR